MAIWNGLTDSGAVVPIQVDDQGRVVVSGGGGLPSQVYGTAKAMATVGFDGTLNSGYNVTTSKTSTGVYRVDFVNQLPDTNYTVVGMGNGQQPRIVSAWGFGSTGFNVVTFDATGAAKDVSFCVAVFNPYPTDVTPLMLPISALNDIERLKVAAGLDQEEPVS